MGFSKSIVILLAYLEGTYGNSLFEPQREAGQVTLIGVDNSVVVGNVNYSALANLKNKRK